MGYYIPVLAYHEISPNEWYYSTPRQFEEHMKYLYENNYTPIDIGTYYKYYTGEIKQEDLPDKPVFIVFDDARAGVYRYAYPILKKYNFPFVVYVIGRVVGDKGFMTWEQMKEMIESGLCELGSHTYDLHYFDLEGPNAETWGAAAIRIWKDNGIYAYDTSEQGTRLESGANALTRYWAIPIAGTAKDYETGALYPIRTYLGFEATKTYTADRLILKCPTHIPAETYYDVKVRVTIGEKDGVRGLRNPIVVNEAWEPKHEPVDLVDPALGETWVNGRFDVIHFNQSVTFQKGRWYNVYFETLNIADEQKEMRIYIDPSLPKSDQNCATNSQSTDYNTIDGWAIHHAKPMIILSNGTGERETYEEYKQRVNKDTERLIKTVEERAGNCITKHYVPIRNMVNGRETAIPIYGASYAKTDEELGDGLDGTFETMEANFKMVFSESFNATKIIVAPEEHFGREYTALVDIYIGDWNNGNPSNFTKVREMYFPVYGWGDNHGGLVEIDFNEGVSYSIVAGREYCLRFVTRNYDEYKDFREYQDDEGEWHTEEVILPIEGTFRIQGRYDEDSTEVTAFWNSRTGDGEAGEDNITRVAVQPFIWLYHETSTYPVGKYEPPVWSIAFPFGAYTDELNEVQRQNGMGFQLTILQGVLDTRPYRNLAAVDDLAQIPRAMIINDNLSIPFKDLLEIYTIEKFKKTDITEKVEIYGYVINRPWGCHSLRQNWRTIDVAIFDAYNFDVDLNIIGEPNPDWEWFKSKGKKAYLMFGNYGPNGWDSEVPTAIFNNPKESIDKIEEIIIGQGWDGIAIDFEEVKPEDREIATEWFRELSRRFRTAQRYHPIFVAAPFPFATDPSWAEWFDYLEIAKVVDKINIMTYLDHGSWTEPGPISDMRLFKKRYNELLEMGIPSYKLVGGVGVFGCIWSEEVVAERNMLEILSRINLKLLPTKDQEANEWHVYLEGGGEAWFQAPDTFQNRIKWLYDRDIRSIAIWKLDDDDFSFWDAGFGSFRYKFKNKIFENK